MDDKNKVINNYAGYINNTTNTLLGILSGLGDNAEINAAIIKTAYIEITGLNSQIVILQNELDNYGG